MQVSDTVNRAIHDLAKNLNGIRQGLLAARRGDALTLLLNKILDFGDEIQTSLGDLVEPQREGRQ